MSVVEAGTHAGSHAPGDVEAGLAHETELLRELAAALVRQRAAVAHDRVDDVLASLDDLGRILHALDASRRLTESRRARRAGAPEPPALAAAVAALRAAAFDARREALINHEVLRHGVAAGERFLQGLFQSLDAPAGYAPGDARAGAPGRIVDRRG